MQSALQAILCRVNSLTFTVPEASGTSVSLDHRYDMPSNGPRTVIRLTGRPGTQILAKSKGPDTSFNDGQADGGRYVGTGLVMRAWLGPDPIPRWIAVRVGHSNARVMTAAIGDVPLSTDSRVTEANVCLARP